MNSSKLSSNTEVDYTPEREMHLLKEEEVAAKYFCFPQIVCCYSCPRAFSSHFKLWSYNALPQPLDP